MITIICHEVQTPVAEEFFELFKVPWNLPAQGVDSAVILVCGSLKVPDGGDLVIVFGTEESEFDRQHGIKVKTRSGLAEPMMTDGLPPLYRGGATVSMPSAGSIDVDGSNECIGVARISGRTVIRVGWDLLEEVKFLLGEGQPVEFAHRLTLDEHIGLIRSWIVAAGVPLVEVPPQPHGYPFTVCLTHDVDFLGIRHHLFDRTIIGFVLRALLPKFFGHGGGRLSLPDYLRNVAAVLQLPLIALGLKKDFLNKMSHYSELEKDLGSTFFMIPYKNEPGCQMPAGISDPSPPGWRAARYDIRDYSGELKELAQKGHEISLHGLDAWCDPEKGRRELEAVRSIVGVEKVGVRMHWLYYDHHTLKVLEQAGFDYDSTVGYNDSIGFRSGTAQAYSIPGIAELLELPLIVQDTAMFFRKRMALTEKAAALKCAKLVDLIQGSGGVFTVNWHQRSIAPERNWERFYRDLIDDLKSRGPWFATCTSAVEWFRMRRQIRFNYQTPVDGYHPLRISHTGKQGLPEPVLRRYRPGSGMITDIKGVTAPEFDDEVLTGSTEVQPWKEPEMNPHEERAQ